jgi:hypothetical protein
MGCDNKPKFEKIGNFSLFSVNSTFENALGGKGGGGGGGGESPIFRNHETEIIFFLINKLIKTLRFPRATTSQNLN